MAHSLPPQVEILAVSETNHFKAFLSLHLLLPLPFEIHPASSYYAQGAGMMGIAGGHGGDEEVESRATTSVWLPGGCAGYLRVNCPPLTHFPWGDTKPMEGLPPGTGLTSGIYKWNTASYWCLAGSFHVE